MQGWKLFKHAIGMIVRNWREALRIFLVPTVIGLAGLALTVGLTLSNAPTVTGPNPPNASFFISFISAFILFAVLSTWCLVAWHRYVILEELPSSWIPPFNGGRILSYWGQLLKLALLALLVGMPAMWLIMLLFAASPVLAIVIGIPAYIFAMLAMTRLSVTLPATAVGKPLTFGQAFAATSKSWGALFVMILLMVGLQLLTQGAVAGLAQISSVLSGLLNLAAAIFMSLLNISMLTTLYGHYVEGRSID